MPFVLLPFILTGVVLGTFVDARIGNNTSARLTLLLDAIQGNNDLHALQVVRNAFSSRTNQPSGRWELVWDWIYGLNNSNNTSPVDDSTTSIERQLRQALSTVDGARCLLISSLREIRCNELLSTARSAFVNIGTFEETADKEVYIYYFLSYILVEVMCRRMRIICTPEVLDRIAKEVSQWLVPENNVLNAPPLTFFNLFNSRDTGPSIIQKLLQPLFSLLVPLLLAAMHAVDNKPEIKDALKSFAKDPTSLRRYTSNQSNTAGISVRDMMNEVHSRISSIIHTQQCGSSLVVGLTVSQIVSWITRIRGNPSSNSSGVEDFEAQGGIPESLLLGEEIRYGGAVLVVILMTLHER